MLKQILSYTLFANDIKNLKDNDFREALPGDDNLAFYMVQDKKFKVAGHISFKRLAIFDVQFDSSIPSKMVFEFLHSAGFAKRVNGSGYELNLPTYVPSVLCTNAYTGSSPTMKTESCNFEFDKLIITIIPVNRTMISVCISVDQRYIAEKMGKMLPNETRIDYDIRINPRKTIQFSIARERYEYAFWYPVYGGFEKMLSVNPRMYTGIIYGISMNGNECKRSDIAFVMSNDDNDGEIIYLPSYIPCDLIIPSAKGTTIHIADFIGKSGVHAVKSMDITLTGLQYSSEDSIIPGVIHVQVVIPHEITPGIIENHEPGILLNSTDK